jgi:hypothetical protein
LVDIMSDKSTAERIADGVQAFKGMKPDPANLDKLLWYQTTFAPLLFEFSVEVGGLYRQKNEAELQRRNAYNKARWGYMVEGNSAAKAEARASVDIETLLNNEQQADAEYKQAILLLDHARDVLQAIVQVISHLKAEKRAETYGGGSQAV